MAVVCGAFLERADGNVDVAPLYLQGNLDDLARTLSSYIPPIKGSVVGVESGHIHMDIGAENGMAEGTLLNAYRQGSSFHHPDTGMELGQFEEALGLLEVTAVKQGRSEGRPIDPLSTLQVGDLVRIASSRIPVAVIWSSPERPAQGQTAGPPFLVHEMMTALSGTGRFQVTLLPPRSSLEDASVGGSLYLLQLSTIHAGETEWMGVQMQNTKTGRSLSSMMVQVQPSSPSDSILDTLQYRLRRQLQP